MELYVWKYPFFKQRPYFDLMIIIIFSDIMKTRRELSMCMPSFTFISFNYKMLIFMCAIAELGRPPTANIARNSELRGT